MIEPSVWPELNRILAFHFLQCACSHTQDLTGSFTFEDMSPYLIYRTNGEGSTGKVETLAIWCVQRR